MSIIVQLYILIVIQYLILLKPMKEILADNLFRKVFFFLLYASALRLTFGFNIRLSLFFHESVFLAYALFVPGAYLCLRNFVSGDRLSSKDLIHIIPFLTLCLAS